MRLAPRSLHGRMLALSATATAVALLLAAWAIDGVLERVLVGGLDRRLDAEITLLASTIDADGHVDRARLAASAGALEAGPGWRWRIAGPDGTLGPPDFPDIDERPPKPPGPRPKPDARPEPRPVHGRGPRPVEAPDNQVHARRLTVASRRGPVVLTAAAPRDAVRGPMRDALLPLLATLGVLALLLGAAALVQLRVGLRPLRRLRDQVAAIRAGTRDRLDEDGPAELQPLAAELNALTADNAAALAAARLSAANLAHALKTPVAVLALDLAGQPGPAAAVARIDATIRRHLSRARAQVAGRGASTPLAPAVEGVVAAVRRLHAGRGLVIEAAVPAALAVAVDAPDLDEILGNLVDNAARHAAGRVRVDAARDPADARRVRLTIADDGPGIPAAERERLGRPGARLDEGGDGHGFGLAIAGELARLYGGALTLGDAPGTGLLVEVRLPG